MKKKLLSILVAVAAAFSLFVSACAGNDDESAHEHSWSTEWSSNDTYHWHVCDGCDSVTDRATHTYSSWVVTTPATETTEGEQQRSCVECGYTQKQSIPVLGHTHSWSDTWSSDESGHWYACSGCDERSEEAAHTYKDGVCEICGYEDPDYTPGHVHNWSTEWSKDESGHWHACLNGCNEQGDKDEHTYGSWVVTTPATETTEGEQQRSCNVCGYTQKQTIPVIGHTHSPSAQWFYDGTYHWHTCSGCSELLDKALHSYTWVITKPATATEPGLQTGTCACGATTTATIPATGGGETGGGTEDPDDDKGDTPETGTGEMTGEVEVTYSLAGNESAAFEWSEISPTAAKVEYKLSGSNEYTTVDSALIRDIDGDTARVDVVGLMGGATYDFKITSSWGKTAEISSVKVAAYDRSGYAHFNYTEGVGAYKDDGTIKDNALVIYLTDENKNDIREYAYVNGVKEDISDLFRSTSEVSIGYFLNNRQYSNAEKEKYGIQAASFKYGAVVIRVIGKVNAEVEGDGSKSLIEGLTAYDSTAFGGSEGDNGRMARMVNAKNLTIEGIGTDATIWGWGFHFVSNDNLHQYEGSGKSFEVRNITFGNYPEDAVGMEGTQGTKVDSTGSITSGASSVDADLISPVERCWIHNNSFLPGYSQNPAESDKAEGDGSCDFKRGQYYTASYNYFEYCHKTNLIGSSDSSLQFNISMHHNWWNNCGSRIPLVRNSNIHFYNNYILGDSTDERADLSYVTSARANSYMLAEANYYDGCKSVTELASGGVVKAYNNMYYACFNGDAATKVSSRTEKVSNNCKFTYQNIDYSSFDTDPTLFYYDADNQRSNCYLTSPDRAREEAIKYAGVLKYDYNIDTSMNKTTPSSAISYPSGSDTLTIDLSQVSKGSSTVSGVEFTNITGTSSGTVKGKGQIVTFTLMGDTEVSIVASGSSTDNNPELVGADGKVWASKFTTVNMTLPAGTYFIGTGLKDKESTISFITFKEGATPEEKIALVEAAIDLIPDSVTLDQSCIDLINSASVMYNALSSDLKAQVTNAGKLSAAISQLDVLRVQNVISLIDKIGDISVSNDYHAEIEAARAAYNALSTANQGKVTNYQDLLDAEAEYANIAVEALQNRINGIAAPSTASGRDAIEALLEDYRSIATAYTDLDEDQKGQVTGYDKITAGIATLESALQPYKLADMIDALPDSGWTSSDMSAIGAAKTLYNSLSPEQRAVLTAEQQTKLNNAIAFYDEEMAKTIVILFQKSNSTDYYSSLGVTVSGNYKSGESYTYDGETYSDPLKIESSTSVTITVGAGKTVYLQLSKSGKIKIDGVDYESDSNGYVTVTGLSEGTHEITKNTSCNLYYIVMK